MWDHLSYVCFTKLFLTKGFWLEPYLWEQSFHWSACERIPEAWDGLTFFSFWFSAEGTISCGKALTSWLNVLRPIFFDSHFSLIVEHSWSPSNISPALCLWLLSDTEVKYCAHEGTRTAHSFLCHFLSKVGFLCVWVWLAFQWGRILTTQDASGWSWSGKKAVALTPPDPILKHTIKMFLSFKCDGEGHGSSRCSLDKNWAMHPHWQKLIKFLLKWKDGPKKWYQKTMYFIIFKKIWYLILQTCSQSRRYFDISSLFPSTAFQSTPSLAHRQGS